MLQDKANLLSVQADTQLECQNARNLTLKINYSDELCGEYFPRSLVSRG